MGGGVVDGGDYIGVVVYKIFCSGVGEGGVLVVFGVSDYDYWV